MIFNTNIVYESGDDQVKVKVKVYPKKWQKMVRCRWYYF